jgi:hypothetical protein
VKIRNAPRYQSRLTLAERVQTFDSGVWRVANAGELAAICADDGDLTVIGIPRHLLKRWWSLADREQIAAGFDGYAREVAEYFKYKSWELPATPLMEVVASGGKHDEAIVSSHEMRFSSGVGTLNACISLGDENAAIALDGGSGRIRVILEPGEGLMLPAGGVLWNRSTVGSSEFAVTLLIGSLSATD